MTDFFGADKKGFFTIYAISLFMIISCTMLFLSTRIETMRSMEHSSKKLLYCEMFTLRQVTKSLEENQKETESSEEEEDKEETAKIDQWEYQDCHVEVKFQNPIEAVLSVQEKERVLYIFYDETDRCIMDIAYE